MKRALALAVFFLIPIAMFAQAPAPPAPPPASPLQPTTDENKDLKIAQLQAQLALQNYNAAVKDAQAAYQNYQQKLADLTAAGEKVELAHGWTDVTMNDDTLVFTKQPPTTPPAKPGATPAPSAAATPPKS
jgi:hypothetical protein